MNKKIYLPALSFLFLVSLLHAQEIIKKGNVYYISNTLVVKFKKDISAPPQTLNKSLQNFSVQNFTRLFPPQSKLNKGEESLSRIYLLK